MVQAYILIQTEVGKAASVAEAIASIAGVALAEDVTGPYDVIARVEANTVDELGKLVIAKIQDVRGHHPHPHLHGGPRLSARPGTPLGTAARGRSASAAVVLSGVRCRPSRSRAVRRHAPRLRAAAGSGLLAVARPTGSSAATSTRRRPATPPRWGDPAVIARCGVAGARADRRPSASTSTASTGSPSGSRDGTRFTTFGRDPAIEVLVPRTTRPRPLLCPAFADARPRDPAGERPPLPLTRPVDPQRKGSAQADGAGQGEVDELVDELGVATPPSPPTSAGTSSAA